MMITTPGAAPAPVSATPIPKMPAPPASAPPAQTPPAKAPQDADAEAAAAKQAAIEQLEKTTATDAMVKVDEHLKKIAALSVGGGTPEGAKNAQAASALLTDASMLLQHAHLKAMEQLRTMATELHMRLMASASGLAFLGGQVAIAGSSKQPVKLADVIAKPMADTEAAMADVIAAIAPKKSTPAPTPAPAPVPAPATKGAAAS